MSFNLTSFTEYCRKNSTRSYSQLTQDLLVAYLLQEKQNGFFVEFGATDGILNSNSYLLENDFHWRGILAEPARTWHDALRQNRTAALEMRCVWSKSGKKVEFHEADAAELSTMKNFITSDRESKSRAAGKRYTVETISLEDMLKVHKAPKAIDYLSIDTEGSEYSILERFRFQKFDIKIVTVEHNYRLDRAKIYDLLVSAGFIRIFDAVSDYDDWYVSRSLIS